MRLPLFLILLGCALLGACNDKFEDPFSGNDNHITSFSLTKNDASIKAAISEDEIILTVPVDFSLSGAVAEVTVSENATIIPDPASITDWESEHVFVVTAFNGNKRSYLYRATGEGSLTKGSVILETQADVDAFGQSGVTEITGSLIIGAASGRDPITTIAPLNSVERVRYGVTIKATYANEVLDGLTALQAIGGTLRIEAPMLKNVEFPALKSIGDIEVQSKTLEIIEFPKLSEVSNNINLVIVNLSRVNAPLLETIGGNITFTVSDKQRDKSMLQEITFPSLKSITGTLNIDSQPNIGKIDLPEILTSGAITINISASLTVLSINMPKLEECKGRLYLNNVDQLQELILPSLVKLGSLDVVYCSNMEEISMPKLMEVTGDFRPDVFTNLAPDGFKNFTSLTSIGGTFLIKYGPETSLESLTLPPALKSCKTLQLDDCFTLENIDISGIEIEELVLSRATLLGLTIKGDQVFNGSIHVDAHERSNVAVLPYEYVMPKFDGIKETGSLAISPNHYGYAPNMTITGITKINGNFKVNGNAGRPLTTFSVQSITEVTGDVTTFALGADCDFEFAALQKVGGAIMLGYQSSQPIDCKRISFPALTETGDVSLNIIRTGGQEILMPKLATIRGELKLTGPQTNNVLTNLDGFGNLKTVTRVHIENMQALESYEGLKNCVNSIAGEEQWLTINNLYNPTLADMKAGKWNRE